MSEHSRYEELCALAAVGQISEAELAELQPHVAHCDFCQQLQSEFVELGALWLSPVQKDESDDYDPRSALRQRVLRNLQQAGAEFSAPVRKQISKKRILSPTFAPVFSQRPMWAFAAVLIVIGIIGFGIGSYRHFAGPVQPTVASITPSPVIEKESVATSKDSAELIAAKQKEKELRTEKKELQKKLTASEAERARKQAELAALLNRISVLQKARTHDAAEIAQLRTVADNDRNAALTLQAQLSKLEKAQATRDAELVAAQYQMRELESKLSEQAAAAERERQMMAVASSSEMRDVIGSRNLHIVDVADVDNHGARKPFGRVFYTEGKSLIFYAYDLANTKGKQTFYAWGHREGDPHTTRALGALLNDDQAQRRWVFKCNDAKVLAQIDSVYVTLEPSDRPGDTPRGKKLLNAYLGTPANHP